MADSRKFCTECFSAVPPGWNLRYCPSCGGRIKLKLVKKRSAPQGYSRMPESDEPKKERKPHSVKLSRKLIKPNPLGIFAAREKSALGPRFKIMSPSLLFILNALSLGLRSTCWVINRMRSLFMMAKPEEKDIKALLSVWIASFCAHLILATGVIFGMYARGADIEYLTGSYLIRAEAAVFTAAFLINRYILYWTREVIIDELLTSGQDVIRSRAFSFAPSPLLIWFAGVPYIQYHINRMIRKKGLNAYTPSKGARVKKSKPQP